MKTFKVIAIAIMMATGITTMAFGQNNDNDANGTMADNYDFAYLYFNNMGNLPTTGTVTITWVHPTYSTTKTFDYKGTDYYMGAQAANDWVQIIVVVKLPVTNFTYYKATKTQPGTNTTFYFTESDFVLDGIGVSEESANSAYD